MGEIPDAQDILLETLRTTSSITPSLTLQGSMLGHSVGMLLDSGASANLMHPALASKLGVRLGKVPWPITVILADGSRRECNQVVSGLDLRIKDQASEETADTKLQFFVANMPGSQHDIILGMPFLKKENPTVDWLRRTVELRTTAGQGTTIHASSATFTSNNEPPIMASRSAIRRAARTAGAVTAVVHITSNAQEVQVQDESADGHLAADSLHHLRL